MSTEIVELNRNFCVKCTTLDKNVSPLYCRRCGNTDLIPEPKDYLKLEDFRDFKPSTGQISVERSNIANIPQHEIKEEKSKVIQIDPEIKKQLKQPFAFVTGVAGSGKAQPLDEIVMTPDGEIRIGSIKIGDFVLGRDGKPTKVTGVFPQGSKEIVEIFFSDNSSTQCCYDHLWKVQSYKNRRGSKNTWEILPTSSINKNLRAHGGTHKNYKVPMASIVEFKERLVDIDPYLLGLLLGDGSFRGTNVSFSTNDPFLLKEFTKAVPDYAKVTIMGEFGHRIVNKYTKPQQSNIFFEKIKGLGLANKLSYDKTVPNIYKYNSSKVRLAVLQGIMDTDGTISDTGLGVTLSTSSIKLANDVVFLIQSLGGIAKISSKIPIYELWGSKTTGARNYIISVCLPPTINPFRLPRKAKLVVPKSKYIPKRYIDKIVFIGFKEAVCITVENLDQLYLTRNFIVTHNSTCIRLMAEADPNYIELTSTTGISAINLGGRTINSVLKYFNTKSLEDIYHNGKLQWALRTIRNTKRVLGIEEVSMMDAKQLDLICSAVDEINNDASGKTLGIHLVGDFLQLPPVKAEFAFKSQYWDRFNKNTIHLKKIWRQENADFIRAMNYARAGHGNSCVAQLIDCGVKFTKEADNNFDGTTLISLNLGVDDYNDKRLKQIISPMIRVLVKKQGLQLKEWEKLIPIELRLKIGAYVMILSNDVPNFNYVNGDSGYIREYNPKTEKFLIELVRNGKSVWIGRIMRENNSPKTPDLSNPYGGFSPYASRNSPGEWVIGNILYHPLRLAWASSVHKAQGLSLDKIQIDTRADFFSFPALAYVALSRARTAAGLVLVGDPSQIAKKIRTSQEVRRWI